MRKYSKVVKNMYKNGNIVLAFIVILLTGCSNFSAADDADNEGMSHFLYVPTVK